MYSNFLGDNFVIFSGNKYWRFDDVVGRVELDYPRDISMWRGVPADLDAAFQYIDGKTYFFKGKHYWQFDDYSMRVVNAMPKPIGTHWMQCPKDLIRNPFERDDFSSAVCLQNNLLLWMVAAMCFLNHLWV